MERNIIKVEKVKKYFSELLVLNYNHIKYKDLMWLSFVDQVDAVKAPY